MMDRVSALIDGDLDETSARTTIERLRTDDVLRERWDTYCLIGDTLRGEPAPVRDLTASVMESLADEPTVMAPRVLVTDRARGVGRMLLPLAASIMGVAAVGWVAQVLHTEPGVPAQVAVIAPATTATGAIEPASFDRGDDPYRE